MPQGSNLVPLLFMIYMNDINNASPKLHAILFVDGIDLTSISYLLVVDIDNN